MRPRLRILGLCTVLCAPLAACTQTAGSLDRAPREPVATASTAPAASTAHDSRTPGPQSKAELAAAFASAVRHTRGAYLSARSVILRQPGARAYLSERLASAVDEDERFVASVLIGWLDEREAFEDAQRWLTDGARRTSNNSLGYVRADAFGANMAEEAGAAIALPLLELWVKTFEHERSLPRQGPWGHGLWDDGYEADAVVSALHALGDPRGYDPLLGVALARSQPDARRKDALYMLSGVSDPRVDEVLARVLQDAGERLPLRMVAADCLLERRPPQARAWMEKLLLDPRSPLELKRELVHCLRRLDEPASVLALEPALERAREPELLTDVCDALGALGDRKSLPLLWSAAKRVKGQPRTQCVHAIQSIRARLAWPEAQQRSVPR